MAERRPSLINFACDSVRGIRCAVAFSGIRGEPVEFEYMSRTKALHLLVSLAAALELEGRYTSQKEASPK